MSKVKRFLSGNRKHPEIVTGNFNLEYEDVIKRNRMMVIALLGFGIIGAAALLPIAVYRSVAETPVEETATVQPAAAERSSRLGLWAEEVKAGKDFTVSLTAISLGSGSPVSVRIKYDPAKLTFMSAEPKAGYKPDSGEFVSAGDGFVALTLNVPSDEPTGTYVLSELVFRPKPAKAGTSKTAAAKTSATISIDAENTTVNAGRPGGTSGVTVTY
jgi:hypothetical protein